MQDKTSIRDSILEAALPHVPFDGWLERTLIEATLVSGFSETDFRDAFPGGVNDAVLHFSSMVDRRMLESLEGVDQSLLKVRERVGLAVKTRLKILQPHKEATRQAMTYWLMPFREPQAVKALWWTADRIWVWAGDTSTDYNRYTKRSLLSGVIASTMLSWFNDNDPDMVKTYDFLDRRIENVMNLGRIMGKLRA
ncbi:MAG: COQ9 family protein [Rhodospirillales bacterium]|nr:COQ9 family protein [Rhodospirillales bacterium]